MTLTFVANTCIAHYILNNNLEKINLILNYYCLITQSATFDFSLSCSTCFQFVALSYNINVPLHITGWQSYCVASQLSIHADPEHIEFAVYEKLCKMYKTEICRKVEIVDVLIIFTVERIKCNIYATTSNKARTKNRRICPFINSQNIYNTFLFLFGLKSHPHSV